jgi:hypothetical protein
MTLARSTPNLLRLAPAGPIHRRQRGWLSSDRSGSPRRWSLEGLGRAHGRPDVTDRKHLKRLVRARIAKTGESYTAARRHIAPPTREESSMTTAVPNAATFNCSFCGKSSKELRKLIAGPGVYICDECVALCDGILTEELSGDKNQAGPPPAEDQESLNALAMLPSILVTLERVEGDLRRRVVGLRDRGVSWEQIAEQLGTTPQEAARRFET